MKTLKELVRKHCFYCYEIKPISRFNKNSMICKDCKKLTEIKNGGKNCANGQSLLNEISTKVIENKDKK